MAQQRQQTRDLLHVNTANCNSDHVSVGIRPAAKLVRNRRTARAEKHRRVLLGAVLGFVALALLATAFGYYYISTDDGSEINSHDAEKSEFSLLKKVIHRDTQRALRFGRGSAKGRDSRYWDRDDRRRDEDYNEDAADHASMDLRNEYNGKTQTDLRAKDGKSKSPLDYATHKSKRAGFYNEAGRDELKLYEAKYEASLQSVGHISKENGTKNQLSDDNHLRILVDADDEYDDGIDSDDFLLDDHDDSGNKKEKHLENERKRSHESHNMRNTAKKGDKVSVNSVKKNSVLSSKNIDTKNSRHVNVNNDERTATSQPIQKKKPKHKKFTGSCEMKLLNSTVQLVEPIESQKFARFSLQYTEEEEKPTGQEHWEPRFAGHQTLQERGQSFLARDQKLNCGFVKGLKGYPSTGFDLAEDDVNYISRCHIAVVSAIFGNSDRLRSPTSKKVTRLSRKNVCFVMFIDEGTLQTLSSEGQMLDSTGFIGLWKIVVVKNLPFTDMRRVGKIPKLLSHRLFTSARYSIWLDSKLRLQLDPLLILEYFLWRKDYEFAISNHYDRHCLWEEVAQNKKLNKYNHTVIDQQFAFYQADGLKRFNALDPNKLLPSNVPEGSFIVRAHTPMSNLFSCLWFNEVDRFTPRDQLSFFYTYQKLRRMNPDKPFHLNMFKDCERRAIAKLYRHRSDENLNAQAKE